jgi:predicted peptidase
MPFVFLATFALCALASNAIAVAEEHESSSAQQAKVFEMANIKFNYLLYLPPDYAKEVDKKWPLIIFLHGSGERGSDVNMLKKHGPPKLLEEKESPLAGRFVVVSPQCPAEHHWTVEMGNALLDSILADYRIDKSRVYLTGLSMGGFGTWTWAAANPERFAAIAPICGGGDPKKADKLKDLPIWAFHGEMDHTVPIHRTEEMIEALKAAGDKEVKFTRYPEAGHDSWTKSYANPELYEWFLKFSK